MYALLAYFGAYATPVHIDDALNDSQSQAAPGVLRSFPATQALVIVPPIKMEPKGQDGWRFVYQCSGDGRSLLLAARKLAGQVFKFDLRLTQGGCGTVIGMLSFRKNCRQTVSQL